jgi:bifunctional N-acetylglucosamine-1-phosphate-uridyltransferase/glucosamine-1-phosphate-acetyltransferase GlmU-like protein
MRNILLDLKPDATIIGIPSHKKGPVFTTKYVYDYIGDDEEVLISYCDSPFIWKRDNFTNHIDTYNLDGCLITHTGFQPHFLETTKMAFVKTSNIYPLIMEVQEKKSYTNNPQNEHASGGCYYFKKGLYIKKYFDLLMEANLHYNNEYYITLVYNLLINDNLRIGYYDSLKTIMLGTPESVDNFESWMKIIQASQCKNIQDINNCYLYWKDYNENYIP